MKKFCIILLISINTIFQANAQDEKIKDFTNLFCNCINQVMADFHPKLKKMIIDVAEVGEVQAEQNLIQYLIENQDETDKIMSDVKKMGNIETLISTYPNCENIYQKVDELKGDDQELQSKIMDYFNSQTDCELTSAILKTALKDDK